MATQKVFGKTLIDLEDTFSSGNLYMCPEAPVLNPRVGPILFPAGRLMGSVSIGVASSG